MAAESVSFHILVTNGSGNVGPTVVKELLAAKHKVRVAARDPSSEQAQANAAAGAEVVQVDPNQPDTLTAALAGVDKVCLLTPLVPEHQLIVSAWVGALSAAKDSVKHVVRLSCFHAGDPKSLADRWHALNEVLISTTDIPTTYVRPTFYAENIFLMAPAIKDVGDFCHPCTKKLAYIHAGDVGKVLATIAGTAGEQYHGQQIQLMGPEAYDYSEVAAIISKVAGKDVTYNQIDVPSFGGMLASVKFPDTLVTLVTDLYATVNQGDDYKPDDSVKQILGEDAKSLTTVIEENADLFR